MKKLCSLLLVCTFAPMLFGATSQVASQLAQEVERQNYKHNQIVAQQQAQYEKDIAPIQAFLKKYGYHHTLWNENKAVMPWHLYLTSRHVIRDIRVAKNCTRIVEHHKEIVNGADWLMEVNFYTTNTYGMIENNARINKHYIYKKDGEIVHFLTDRNKEYRCEYKKIDLLSPKMWRWELRSSEGVAGIYFPHYKAYLDSIDLLSY